MKLVVGLGNPGEEYVKTRHNAGFQVIDLLREELQFDEFKLKKKFDAEISEGTFEDEKVILAKPTTFMNLSGHAVQKIAKFYDIVIEDIFIIYDDLDFETGTFKIREKGSAGSHNGMISVIQSLGSEDIKRFRVGIESRTEEQKGKFSGKDYVLSKFTSDEEKNVAKTRKQCAEAILYALKKGINEAMNKFN
ncbi:aminoacyl-tRNA hydrolase [Patescibacteria group bacterium]